MLCAGAAPGKVWLGGNGKRGESEKGENGKRREIKEVGGV